MNNPYFEDSSKNITRKWFEEIVSDSKLRVCHNKSCLKIWFPDCGNFNYCLMCDLLICDDCLKESGVKMNGCCCGGSICSTCICNCTR